MAGYQINFFIDCRLSRERSGRNSPHPVHGHRERPNTGGQDDGGAFVTVYGNNFGTIRWNSIVAVGGGQAESYPVWTG